MNEMLKSALTAVLSAAVAVLVYAVLVGGNQPDALGGYTRFPNSDLQAKSITVSTGNLTTTSGDLAVGDDATISGGSLDVTTSNTATSTVKLGCIQLTATSTASPIKMVLGTPANHTATTSIYGATTIGAVYYAYGNCP